MCKKEEQEHPSMGQVKTGWPLVGTRRKPGAAAHGAALRANSRLPPRSGSAWLGTHRVTESVAAPSEEESDSHRL